MELGERFGTNVLLRLQFQTLSRGEPPQSPETFNPDSGVPPISAPLFGESELQLQFRVRVSPAPVPQAPAVFNPDPGAWQARPEPKPILDTQFSILPPYRGEPIEQNLDLPRESIRRGELEPVESPPAVSVSEPVPNDLKLPRTNTWANQRIEFEFHNPDYPLSRQGQGYPTNAIPRPDRWRIGFVPWRRYTVGRAEMPYESPAPLLWHPYRQSLLKGDLPIIGPDIFLNLTASSSTEFEARRIPTPSGVSAARADNAEFFGQSEQFLVQQYFGFNADLFKGETSFKPVKWAVRLQPVANINYLYARETGVVSPDPRGLDERDNRPPPINSRVAGPADVESLLQGELSPAPRSYEGESHSSRTRDEIALQEGFVEVHLADLSDNYDFIAVRVGSQVFNSDFRGFIFNDVNLGARFFGNADNNRLQYNLAAFQMREKDTFSDLNTFDERGQRVLIANVYRQDFIWRGYTAQLSFHANFDEGGRHYDRAGNIARPAPIGAVRDHDVQAYYFGWAGDGHIGRLNLSHAVYQAIGRDEFNGLAGQPADINAQMAALELSYDRDWIRYKASFFYASGDDEAEDGNANGFDTILENPNFTGGPFSFYVRQGFNLAGTSVGLKQRGSLVTDLRTSKTEGQANFVNPGVFVYGLGAEIDVTPKLRSFVNANYVRFAETDPIQTSLLADRIDRKLGYDLSLGFQYRPLLTDNIILSAGFGAFLPGQGYKDIYRRSTDPLPGLNSLSDRGRVDDFLYSALLAVTLRY
ncbi:MAG: hypothetical protein HY735_29435 [Verrucomicrobia bacterium]|nr:hypothetical protein [Verrucomicrobiota bacterium]